MDILLPGPNADKRVAQLASEATYADLISAGIRIWNFQPSMLHTKALGSAKDAGDSGHSHPAMALVSMLPVSWSRGKVGGQVAQFAPRRGRVHRGGALVEFLAAQPAFNVGLPEQFRGAFSILI